MKRKYPGFALIIIIGLLTVVFWGCSDDDNPVIPDNGDDGGPDSLLASVEFSGDTLKGLNNEDSVIWTYVASSDFTVAVVGDLDGDGYNEAVGGTADNGSDMGVIYAINGNGVKMWGRATGVGPAGSPYAHDEHYAVNQIEIVDVDGDQDNEVVSASYHTTYYPGRLCIISKGGALEGEYWHPGQRVRFVITDFDGDGVKDILCGAGNNDFFNTAAMFRLAGNNVHGEAPPDLGDFPAGSQIWYTNNQYSGSGTYAVYCAEIALVDVIGDATLEIRYTDYDGYMWYCDKDGNIVIPEF